jgi:hypothetical protein
VSWRKLQLVCVGAGLAHDPTAHLGKRPRSQRNTIHSDRRQSALFTGRTRPERGLLLRQRRLDDVELVRVETPWVVGFNRPAQQGAYANQATDCIPAYRPKDGISGRVGPVPICVLGSGPSVLSAYREIRSACASLDMASATARSRSAAACWYLIAAAAVE